MRVLYLLPAVLLATAYPHGAEARAGDQAPACGEFTPMITPAYHPSPFTQVHFFPKHCNKIMIGGKLETIPPGVGVISGGVIGTVTSACIDKTCGKVLAASTLYRVYVYMDGRAMKLDFSTGGHKEDAVYGNEVHVSDPGRSLVGMIRTNEKGTIDGNANSQMTISWFNRGETGLVNEFSGANTCSSALVEIPNVYVEFLTFGINDTFKQAFTVPNVYLSANIASDTVGGHASVAIKINGAQGGHPAEYYQHSAEDVGNVHAEAIGAAGANEGYVKAVLMMSNGGAKGCVSIRSGALYTSPLQS